MKNTDRYLCIHGHFYQPPRENPWAGIIYNQKSAWPYHDWNERITRECYGPNTRSRLHGEKGYISKLVNNFELISFNFGPTLLNWLEKYNPWVYAQIINADILSAERFGGHGNAMAQVYNHLIMPLASERDKITQVKWGLEDFYHRFNRKAEGMWLSETAVDSKTLAVMANEGVKFTVLSPYQAHLVRPLDSDKKESTWKDVSGGNIDYTKPYRCFPTDDKNLYIDIFFYNGPLSKAIAYEKILGSGEVFLKRIKDTYPPELQNPALVSMATDGESYGHHFKFGEMALTWVLEMINNGQEIQLTNYGEFLEKFPPKNEVRIIENSSWSCAHGIERWRSDCGCSVSQNPGWTQSWRAPLRNGLNWLNEHLSSIYEEKTKYLLKDCWETRNDYIHLLLKPGEHEKSSFLEKHAAKSLNKEESELIFRLLDSQQMSLYMFTSCGWFFDDISGLEPIQILMYAKKAIEICRDFSSNDLEEGLKGFLSEAVGNNPEYENGMDVYNKKVTPYKLDPLKLLANYSMISAMDDNQLPEWLKTHVTPKTEKMIHVDGATIYLCETVSREINKDISPELISVCLITGDNELTCFTGNKKKQKKKILLDEIEKQLTIKGDAGSIIKILKKYTDNTDIFTLKDLIPDIQILVIKILTSQIENRLHDRFSNNILPVENYLKALIIAKEDLPVQFNDLLKSMFSDQIIKLLKSSADIPIDFSNVEKFLELFIREPGQITTDNNKVLVLDNLVNQHRVSVAFEEYLFGQINNLKKININVCLNNIINMIDFINKYKIALDWWKSQNTFNEFRIDMDFIKRLENNELSLFRQIEHLLGFTRGEEYA
ncbi:MAG: DUF3536 domain-containing protein [Deltaproteobacteria bacterium]|nr:DUF3536 domain-containing protein [Deltaproteobacteria bacterium]